MNNIEKNIGTLVTVGFMPIPFRRLFDMLLPLVDTLPRPIVIQSGALKNHELFNLVDMVVDFASSHQMKEWTQQASLIISHAGVGNAKLANSFGKMIVLVPRKANLGEHIDEHQTELSEILSTFNLATIVAPETTTEELLNIIARAKSYTKQTVGKIEIEIPNLNLSDTVLAVSSVGGHRIELENLISNLKDGTVIRMTDEICDEVNSGVYLRFPSCNKRRNIPIRFIQALIYLFRHPDIQTIVTTGAGVGAVFVLAAKILKVRTIAIESLTRINSPGLWFKLAGRISDEAYAYSWSQWLTSYTRVKKIEIKIV